MSARSVVYSADEIEAGDIVAYPGIVKERGRKPWTPDEEERDPRDWLKVTRVEGRYVYGERVNPLELEQGIEFAIYPLQIEENGVFVAGRNDG